MVMKTYCNTNSRTELFGVFFKRLSIELNNDLELLSAIKCYVQRELCDRVLSIVGRMSSTSSKIYFFYKILD